MAEERLSKLLGDVRVDDLRLDELGRVVITSPAVAEGVRELGTVRPDLEAAARKDTNIICCGNGTCRASSDLGGLVERFTGPGATG